eukprot:COSAG03_NODE_6430_length_1061_cov_1.749480_1_plen_213_part_01
MQVGCATPGCSAIMMAEQPSAVGARRWLLNLSITALLACATALPSPRSPPKTEAELLGILSRAATVSGFLNPNGAGPGANTTDTIRMLAQTGARYAGRSVFVWGGEAAIPSLLPHVKTTAAAVHAAAPDVILEGAVFEIVTVRNSIRHQCTQHCTAKAVRRCPDARAGLPLQKPGVESLTVPDYVFEAFGLPATARKFNYSAMLFPGAPLSLS